MHFVVLGIAFDHMVEMEIATFGKSIECRAVAVERSVRLHVGVGRIHCNLEVRALVVDGNVVVDLRVGQARTVLPGLDTFVA